MFKRLFLVLFFLLSFAFNSFAAISATDQTAILDGISAADAVYYAIGGGLLVVMAGIWGFKMVKRLLG